MRAPRLLHSSKIRDCLVSVTKYDYEKTAGRGLFVVIHQEAETIETTPRPSRETTSGSPVWMASRKESTSKAGYRN